jgi:tetratricopeptide (TPR) repeat protein
LNDASGAGQTALKAEEVSRKADEITRCQQIANAGLCLLEVEEQIPRALVMIDEAETMARTFEIDFIEVEWARSHAARWRGDFDSAHALMTRAVELARLREERWREVECLIWLAMINLERQKSSSVEQSCNEIDDIAGRLNQALPPVSAVFRLLAQFDSGRNDLRSALDQALASLRDFDDKAHLAYALNFVAHEALSRDQYSQARIAAAEALTAAQAMSRTTEIVVAASILARVECACGDLPAAIARLQALMSECDCGTFSARARTSLERAAHDVDFALAGGSNAGQAVHVPANS